MRGFAMGGQQFPQFFAPGSRASLLGPVPMGVAIKTPHMGYPRHFSPHARYFSNVRMLVTILWTVWTDGSLKKSSFLHLYVVRLRNRLKLVGIWDPKIKECKGTCLIWHCLSNKFSAGFSVTSTGQKERHRTETCREQQRPIRSQWQQRYQEILTNIRMVFQFIEIHVMNFASVWTVDEAAGVADSVFPSTSDQPVEPAAKKQRTEGYERSWVWCPVYFFIFSHSLTL